MEKSFESKQKICKKHKKKDPVRTRSVQAAKKDSKYRYNKLAKLTQPSSTDASTKFSTCQVEKSKILVRSPLSLKKKKKNLDNNNLIKPRKSKLKKTKTEISQKIGIKQHRFSQIDYQKTQFDSFANCLNLPKLQFFKYFEEQIPIQNTYERRFVQKLNIYAQKGKARNTKINYQKIQAPHCHTQKKQNGNQMNNSNKRLDKYTQTKQIEIKNCLLQTEKKLILQNKLVEQRIFNQNVNQCFKTSLEYLLNISRISINIQQYDQKTNIDFFLKIKEITNLFAQRNGLKSQNSACEQHREQFSTQTNQNSNNNLQQIFNGFINQRWCIQMGWVRAGHKRGIDTDICSILQYLSNLFCYCEIAEKKQIVNNVRSIFGYPYRQRLKRIQKGKSSISDCQPIISNKLFLSLERELAPDQLKQNLNQQERQQKIRWSCYHNRAIFDCVNQILQTYKPFYYSKGEPFPWTNSLIGTTYFIIDQESLQLLFKQAKDKLLAISMILNGIFIQESFSLEQQKQEVQIFKKSNSGKQSKLQQYNHKQLDLILKEDLRNNDFTVFIEEQITFLLVQISYVIQKQLFSQAFQEIAYPI